MDRDRKEISRRSFLGRGMAGIVGAGLGIAGADKVLGNTPQESAEAVINVIDQYNLKMTATFMSHRGDVIPW